MYCSIGLGEQTPYFCSVLAFTDVLVAECTYIGLSDNCGSPYSITERRVPELIPVLGSQPAGDVSRKPGGRLPLLSARPTPATPRELLPILLHGEQRHDGCEQFV